MYIVFGVVFIVLTLLAVFMASMFNLAERSKGGEESSLPPVEDIVEALKAHIETMNKSSKARLGVEDAIKHIQDQGYDVNTPGEFRLLAQTIRTKHKNKYPNGFLEAAGIIERIITEATEGESSDNAG